MAGTHPGPQIGHDEEVSMKLRLFLLIGVFAAFAIYTAEVVLAQGYFGFVELAMTGGWAGQVFLDLCIALVLFASWMIGDGRARGIRTWPYLLAVLTTGSIGALGYLIHRTVKEGSSSAERPARSPAAQRSM
jgi:hypothetical protein